MCQSLIFRLQQRQCNNHLFQTMLIQAAVQWGITLLRYCCLLLKEEK
jgi:hypothetical protein